MFQWRPQWSRVSLSIGAASHQTREGVNSVINTLFGGSSANLVSLSAQGQWGVERGVITGNETAFKVSWNPKFYQRFRNPIDPKKKPKSQKTMPNRWRHKGKGGGGLGGGWGKVPLSSAWFLRYFIFWNFLLGRRKPTTRKLLNNLNKSNKLIKAQGFAVVQLCRGFGQLVKLVHMY